ncbi:Transcription factor Tfb4 family protein [Candida albicans]|uniref:General transcription and DNA repair factor IIH subunit TFB4 n=1 Tax=Candida albicans TaxID=5476 RepID=A0A8H6C313_CANAX|nr:Transcription factor Tfb4 family protein [Candida albicans]
MEAISDRLFNENANTIESGNDDPSLLTIILDLSMKGWYNIKEMISIQDITKSLLVFLNGHLSLNNSNQVAFLVSSTMGSKFLYPDLTMVGNPNVSEHSEHFPDMYRSFKMVDQSVLQRLNEMLTTSSSTSMKSRVLIVSANDDDDLRYIPLMNCIFAAQKMKVSIDVAKLGHNNSSYLQQASDATKGVYLHIEDPKGIIQVLSTAFFIEPNLRPYIILPTNSNVNYRASCFITGKSVDLGYVCSVCLCIMSQLPQSGKCPACDSEFDKKIIQDLNREPQVISKKKRKLENGSSTK